MGLVCLGEHVSSGVRLSSTSGLANSCARACARDYRHTQMVCRTEGWLMAARHGRRGSEPHLV